MQEAGPCAPVHGTGRRHRPLQIADGVSWWNEGQLIAPDFPSRAQELLQELFFWWATFIFKS
jgi:hypothetical protein